MEAPMPTQTALKHYVILANPSARSFDHAIAQAYLAEVNAAGQEGTLCDLNAIAFDPVLKPSEKWGPDQQEAHPWVRAELDRLRESHAIVLIYPIWFGGPPAILKGYVDRVLGAGCDVERFAEGLGQPALSGKRLLSFTTSGTPLTWLEDRGQLQTIRQGFDVYLERGFGLRDEGHIHIDNVVRNMSTAHVDAQLDRVRDAARNLCAALDRPRAGK